MSLGGDGSSLGGSTGTWHWYGSGLDDGPGLQARIAQAAAIGARLVLHGLVLVNTTIATPTNGNPALVHLAANCEVRANISGGAVFLANSLGTAANPPGGAVTLSGSPPVAGATSVTVNAVNGIVAGNTVLIGNSQNNYLETHTIHSTSSGTLVFNEPISVPPPSGASIYLLSGLACLQITGDPGSKFTGAAEECIEILCGRNCHLSGFAVSMAFTGALPWALYLDWATRDSTVADVTITADATSPGTTAVGLEQCVNVTVERVRVIQAANHFGVAFESTTGTNVWFRDCWAPGSNAGLIFDVTDASNVFGSYGHRGSGAEGCHFEDSAAAITVKNGGQGIHLIACHAPRSTSWAVNVYAPDTGTYPNDVQIVGGDFSASAATAVIVSGGTGHKASGFDGSGSVTALQINGGFVAADSFAANNCTGSAVQVTGGDVALSGFSADNCSYATHGAVYVSGANNRVSISRFTARGATYTGLEVQAGTGVATCISDGDIAGSGTAANGSSAILAGAGRITVNDVAAGYRTDVGAGTRYGMNCGGTADVTLTDVDVWAVATPGGNRVAVHTITTTVVVRMQRVKLVSSGASGPTGGAQYGLDTADAAATAFDLGGVDFSLATSNAYLLGTGTKANWITWTATGSAVTVNNIASPGAQAGWSWEPTAVSGTVGAPFQATAISAGSANFNSTNAADRSTYTGVLR